MIALRQSVPNINEQGGRNQLIYSFEIQVKRNLCRDENLFEMKSIQEIKDGAVLLCCSPTCLHGYFLSLMADTQEEKISKTLPAVLYMEASL